MMIMIMMLMIMMLMMMRCFVLCMVFLHGMVKVNVKRRRLRVH